MSAARPASPLAARAAWRMLLALSFAFVLSQAFRSLAAIMGPPLTQRNCGWARSNWATGRPPTTSRSA